MSDDTLERPTNVSDDAVAGPSGVQRRSVRWDPEKEPKRALRRQSLVGTSGYVSQLLEQSLEGEGEEEREEAARKPLRRQSVAERRDSMRAATADMEYYMREALDSKRRKSSRRSRSGSRILPTLTTEDKMEELQIATAQAPAEDRPSSEWAPSHLLETEVGTRTEISWLGTYVVGKDYWTERGSEGDQDEKVTFGKAEEKTSWYDMPLKKASEKSSGSVLQSMKHRFLEKFDALKDEIDEEYEEKRKQRMISAAQAREARPVAEEWSEEFQQCFRDMCGSGVDRISAVDAEKWLERAQLLDHSKLTALHTGFCFIASGGSRHVGLGFDKFTEFLQMVSPVTGLAVRDLTRRMTACLRKTGG